MIKHYRCPKCGNTTSAEGVIPECKCTIPRTKMKEITHNDNKTKVDKC